MKKREIKKIGMLILNEEENKFLVAEKAPDNVTADYIMPGGQFEEDTPEECLGNEIKEELDCEVDFKILKYIGEYRDDAAGRLNTEVSISLYQGEIIGKPKASSEIKFLHWIGKSDLNNKKVSVIVRNKIIPDLVERKMLK